MRARGCYIEKVKWYERLKDILIENWETILCYVIIIVISWIIVGRLWCIESCKTRYCGVPTRDQVMECFRKCGVPEFLTDPFIGAIITIIVFVSFTILIILVIRDMD
ncbi:MAG: hypothetical protein DRO40_06720 [Thermoprotei archaeon]|nr:MAG: hypothetical protein DRO40_06720 [Thermoprotei archaeon]